MPVCAANGCNNRSSNKTIIQLKLEETSKITFHAFPKNPTRRIMWTTAMGLNTSTLHKQAVLCSQHFKSEDIDRTSLSCVRLRAGAVPYANFPIEKVKDTVRNKIHTENQESRSQLYTMLISDVTKENKKRMQNETLDVDVSKAQSISPAKIESKIRGTSPTAKCSTSLYKMLLKKDAVVQTNFSMLQNRAEEETTEVPNYTTSPLTATPRTMDKSTCVSPDKDFQCPIKEQLREQLRCTKKKYGHEIKKLKQQNRRYNKKIATLKNVLETLKNKNLPQTEEIDV